MIKNAPKRIYLQVGEDLPKNEDVNFKDLNEVTWCEDKINDSDICYIRAGKCYTPDVINRRELLIDFLIWAHKEKYNITPFKEEMVDDYLKSINSNGRCYEQWPT